MPVKHFVISPKPERLSREAIDKIEADKADVFLKGAVDQRDKNEKAFEEESDTIVHSAGRVVIKCNLSTKEDETLSNGLIIARPRDWDCFDMKIKNCTQAKVVSSDTIEKGTMVLIGHNVIHDTNRIFDYKEVTGSDVHYYSIPENQIFLKQDENGDWVTLPPFETALKVWKPYTGILHHIPPTFIKDTLFVTSGELKDKAVKTVKSSDYVITYREPSTGKTQNIIRFRPFGLEAEHREPEAICVLDDTTEKILNDELIIGIEISDAKTYSQWQKVY